MDAESIISSIPISDNEFRKISQIVHAKLGINLTEEKKTLIVGRLEKRLKALGLQSYAQYVDILASDAQGEELHELANRISTNHTYFYREAEHFEYLSQVVLPDLNTRHGITASRDFRLWCAASSSGEEPYCLEFLLAQFFGLDYIDWPSSVLATDISEKALEKARAGIYEAQQIQKLPPALRNNYCTKLSKESWQVRDEYRRHITYRRFNLMNPQFPFKKRFHVIFCRNVMIYFDAPTRDALAAKLYTCLEPGGYLFIGHAETLGRERPGLRYIKPAVYRKES